jgi:hypothetical protein
MMIGHLLLLPFTGGILWAFRLYSLAWLTWFSDLFLIGIFWLSQQIET